MSQHSSLGGESIRAAGGKQWTGHDGESDPAARPFLTALLLSCFVKWHKQADVEVRRY